MKKRQKTGLDFLIDKLTNSIENTPTGVVFNTKIVWVTSADAKQINKTIGNLSGFLNSRIRPKKLISLQRSTILPLFKGC
ncbi:MAG: hypothetical protein WKF91_11760 [Segetibacter sp.]